MSTTLCVALCTVALLIICIIGDIRLRIGRRSIGVYCLVPIAGCIVLLSTGDLPASSLIEYFTADNAANPIKILSLFLSMTVFSLVLDEAGFFTYMASLVIRRAGSSQRMLFVGLYICVALLTVFTSNDVVILTVTPFVIAFCRRAGCNPLPHLLLEFVTANTWSMLLVIGNPTNIYLASAAGIDFASYSGVMTLPAISAGVVSGLVIYLLFHKALKVSMRPEDCVAKLSDKPLAIISGAHLAVCVICLAASSIFDIEMWLIAVICAVSLIICCFIRLSLRPRGYRPLLHSLARLPYETIPFVAGMFALVLALRLDGITDALVSLLGTGDSVYTYGFASALGANLINNIPVSVLFADMLSGGASPAALYATIIGTNIGAFITPVGALAGIMWHNILSHEGIRLSFGRFCLFGVITALPTLLAACSMLGLCV